MIECYKYLSGIYDVSTKFLPLDLNSTTRGHSLKLMKMAATKSCRANYFSRRINNAWNSLPDDVVTAPTLDTFKAAWTEYGANITTPKTQTGLKTQN